MKKIKEFLLLFTTIIVIILVAISGIVIVSYDFDYGQSIFLFMGIALILFYRELSRKDKEVKND